MPVNRIFGAGFAGASSVDSSRWFGEQAEKLDIKSICMPFLGAARHLTACANEGVHMDAWDTQLFGRAIVEGIFKVEEIESALELTPRFRRGYSFNNRWLYGLDDASAGFIDWIAEHGTLADRAAIYSAITKSTYRGRMTEYTGHIGSLWSRYLHVRASFAQFTSMPGIWNAYESNWYNDETIWGSRPYDLLLIDPPKIIGTTDIYSALYGPLNRAVGGKVEMDKWSWRDYIGRMRRILDGVEWEHLFFLYTSDVRPDWATIKKLLNEYGEITDEETWVRRVRFDHTAVVRRK